MNYFPKTLEEALAACFVLMTGLFCWVIRAAFTALTNHFKHDEETLKNIYAHMEKQNLLLDLLVQKVVLK